MERHLLQENRAYWIQRAEGYSEINKQELAGSNHLLLNFDANWYQYLFDEVSKQAYLTDRYNSAKKGIADQNVGQNFDTMENIAERLPLSNTHRPAWDIKVLTTLGMNVSIAADIWKYVWSEEERINFASTPMFMVKAVCA